MEKFEIPQLGARGITWTLDGDAVVLRGRVKTFYEKQLAQTFARRWPGVVQVCNEIEVDPPAASRGIPSHYDG